MSRIDTVVFHFEDNIQKELVKRQRKKSKRLRRRLEVKRKLDDYFDNKRIQRRLGFLEDDDDLMWEI